MLTGPFSVHPFEVFVQTNELFGPFYLRAEIIFSCFEATKLSNVIRFQQQTSKQYVCRKEKRFVISEQYTYCTGW